MKLTLKQIFVVGAVFAATISANAWARDVDYEDSEITVHVTPGEPTQIQFPGQIQEGFKKRVSALTLSRTNAGLMVLSGDGLPELGEALIVQLQDGRSYSLRIRKAGVDRPRDDIVRLVDKRLPVLQEEEEEPAYKEKKFDYAPPSQVSGLVREMVLVSEFGKASVPGYQETSAYRGETVLNDGTLVATIDRIFMGPNLWGYVIDTKNLLGQTQKLNPAAFRIDGTRMVSAKNWELAPTPLTAEQQIAGAHETKVYIVTKARH